MLEWFVGQWISNILSVARIHLRGRRFPPLSGEGSFHVSCPRETRPMNAIIKKAALAAALATVSTSAFAIDAHITVYANVDATLAFQKEDGSALPDSVQLDYLPGIGLRPWKENTRIFSNDESKDIEVKLGSDLELRPTLGNPGARPVPMTVILNGMTLTTAAQDLKATDIFDGAVQGRSIMLPLSLEQTTQGEIVAGDYDGMAVIVMAQKATSP